MLTFASTTNVTCVARLHRLMALRTTNNLLLSEIVWQEFLSQLKIQWPRFVNILFSFTLKRTRYRGRVQCFVVLTFASCLKERLMLHTVSLMALRTTYISCVACACFASWLRDIFCHAQTDFRESDWLLPGRADSIRSDRVCLPTFSTPLAPVTHYFRCHCSSAMHPFSFPVAIGLSPSASEDNPTQVECIRHVWVFSGLFSNHTSFVSGCAAPVFLLSSFN